MTKKTRLGFVVVGLWFFGVLCTVGGWFNHRDEVLLEEHGINVPGTVLEKSRKVRRRRADEHFFQVEYAVPRDSSERRLKKELSVSASIYNATSAGDSVEVRCLPDHPETAKLVGESDDSLMVLGIGIALLIAAGVCTYIWKQRRSRARREITSDAKDWSGRAGSNKGDAPPP